jgi:uncharacterized membrane protein YhaH (DUF805 family)
MSFGEAVRSVFAKYATFDGRAPRSEYWWFQLFNVLVVLVAYVVLIAGVFASRGSYVLVSLLAIGLLLYALATFIPSLAVTVRRLHDSDKSGWWLLIVFVPYIGAIVLFIFMLLPSSPGINQFGPPFGMAGDMRRVSYRAPSPTEAWAKYTEDAQRAAANGYQPVSQQWRRDGLGDYLEVVYTTYQQQWQTPSAAGWQPGAGWLNPSGAADPGRSPLDGPPPDRSGSG